jgi:hypothetical protein
MSLFPFVSEEDVKLSTPEVTASSIREYEIDFKTGRFTGGIVEGVDAIATWAYLAIKATRYRWPIYSWNYGEEYTSLLGQSYSDEYLHSEVKRYLEECLFENEHITGIENLIVSREKDLLSVRFTLVTDVGSKEVDAGV